MKQRAGTLLIGLLFGFSLSRIGFGSWGQVHDMFTFRSWRLILTFAAAIAVLAASWAIIRAVSNPKWTKRKIHPGTLIGGAIFGVGWAVSGACPSIALVQLGEGQLGAVWTIAGLFVGNWLYPVIHERFFKWTPGTCADP